MTTKTTPIRLFFQSLLIERTSLTAITDTGRQLEWHADQKRWKDTETGRWVNNLYDGLVQKTYIAFED